MVEELDSLDQEILKILETDGRAALSRIAEQVGISRPAVADRVEKLQRTGVIRGATVIVDPATVGKNVTAFVSARQPAPFDAKAAKAFRELLQAEEVLEIHSIAGEDCYLVKVRTESIASLNDFINRLAAPPLSLSTRTTIVMETHIEKMGGISLSGKADG